MRSRLAAILILAAGPALGQDSVEDALDGFEDGPAPISIDDVLDGFNEQPAPVVPAEASTPPSRLRVGGRVRQEIIANIAHVAPVTDSFDHRGLSSLRTRLDLEADADFGVDWRARITGHAWYDLAAATGRRRNRPSAYADAYGREAELGEFFLQGPVADRIDLTLGRQVIVWGPSDQFRINDVLNPLDRRLPGMTDFKDLRLASSMARLDLYARSWSVSMIAVPERRFDKLPVPGSDFLAGSVGLPPRDAPGSTFGTPGAAVALTGTFPGWDLSFHAARIHDSRPHVAFTHTGPRLRHGRVNMAGAAGSAVFGNWLIKAEAAVFSGERYTNERERTFSSLRAMAGAEYAGLADTSISLDAANTHIFSFDRNLEATPDGRHRNEPATAIRVSRRFLHDTVEISLVALTFGLTGENGSIQRLQASYDPTDSARITAGLVLYNSGNLGPFREIGSNDRLFLTLDYHF